MTRDESNSLVLCQEHKEHMARIYALVRENFMLDKRLMPVAFLLTIHDKLLILGMAFRDEAEKVMSFDALRMMAEVERADTVVTAIEAWTVMASEDGKIPQGSLEYHPERREVILLILHVRATPGAAWEVMVPITRSGSDVSIPEQMPSPEYHNLGGRLVVFPEKEVRR